MFDILRDKTLYNKMIVAAIPLSAVCCTAFTALLSAAAMVATVVLSALLINLLKNFLNKKIARFAHIIIAVGIAGVSALLLKIIAEETIVSIGFYLPLLAVTSTILADSDFAMENEITTTVAGGAVTSCTSGLFLLTCGIIREVMGIGSVFGMDIYTKWFSPMAFFATPAGGLLTAAILTVIYNFLVLKTGKKEVVE